MIEYINKIPEIEDYWPLYLSTKWNSVYNLDAAMVKKAISNSTFAVSAYIDGNLIGFSRAVSDKVLYATIYDVIVLPKYQKRGIGKSLVANVTKQCKAAGVMTVHLFAAEDTVKFYTKLGYKPRPPSRAGMSYEPENA